MSIVIGWLILSAIVSVAASSRGRNGIVWFLIAIVTSPLIAVLFVFASEFEARGIALKTGQPAARAPSENYWRPLFARDGGSISEAVRA